MRKYLLAACGAASLVMLAASTPATAQQSSYKSGDLWVASRIDVEDGQFENYMDYITRVWVDNQAYAKKQGWLLDYYILDNLNKRDGEPDIILLTRYTDFPSVAETERRDKLINERMKQDAHSAAMASGERTKMRKLLGTVLYRELHAR